MIRKSHKNQEGEQGMKKWISRTLSIILSALMIVTSLPMEAFAAAQGVDAVIGDAMIMDGDTSAAESDAEDTNEEGTADGADGESAVAPETEPVEPSRDFTFSGSEYNYVTGAAWAIDKNGNSDYVGDGDEYLYSTWLTGTAGGDRELYSALHNDMELAAHTGKWYEGHEVIYYPAQGKKVYENSESASALESAPEFTGKMVFEMKYMPAELSDQFYHFQGYENNEGVYKKLKAQKLEAWEYESYKAADGSTRYRRVKTVEIGEDDYEVSTEEGAKYTNDLGKLSTGSELAGYTPQMTLSGKVCLNSSDFSNPDHPIAIVALAYDAAKDAKTVRDLANTKDGGSILWDNDPIFDLKDNGYGSETGFAVIYPRSYNYYTDDLYTASAMGSFSLNPYNYYIDEDAGTITLYGCSYYNAFISGFMRGYKDDFRDTSGSGLMIDTWEIPATYTYNGKSYKVIIGDRYINEFGTFYGTNYPNMTSNLIIDAGVTFPEDCTDFMEYGSMYGICPSTVTIKGDVASTGGNIKNFTNFFSHGTYRKLDIAALDTSSAECMAGMFAVTLSPSSVSDLPDITHFDTSKVTDMSGMFQTTIYNASGTEYNIDVSRLNTSKVTNFSHMFDGYHVTSGGLNARYYPSIDTSRWDTSSAKDMSWMFANVLFMDFMGTGTLDISGLDFTPSLKTMQGMFYGNRRITEYSDDALGLTKIIFPKDMDTTGVTDMSLLFANCATLSQIENFTALDTDNVTDMSMMFGTALEDRLFGSVRTVPEPADYGHNTGSWAIDRLTNVLMYNTASIVNYYHGYPGDYGPAFTSLDLSNFNTKNLKYAYGMFYRMQDLTEIKWGKDTTFENLTDANNMFVLPKMASLDLTGRKFDSVKFANNMIELANADEIILGEGSLDLTHLDKSLNGRFSISAPVFSMDFSEVKFGRDSFDANSLYNGDVNIYAYWDGLTEVEELIFPADVPAFTSPAKLRTTFFDEEGGAYDYFGGGNDEKLTLTSSAAGYVITDFKAGNMDYAFGVVGNGGTLDVTIDLADQENYNRNNLSAYFYVEGNSGYDTAKLAPTPDIQWSISGDAVTMEVESGQNTNDYVHLTVVKAGTATVTLSVEGGEYTATFNITVYDSGNEVSLYSADGSIYKANQLSDGNYIVTGFTSLHSDDTIDLRDLRLGSASGPAVTVSRIGNSAFDQSGSDYHLRDTMKEIYIPASVTEIGANAFYNMTVLEKVAIGDESSLKAIGNNAFSSAGSANGQSISYDSNSNEIVTYTKNNPFEINLPEGLETIGNGAFSEADLATLTIPSTVRNIGTNCFTGKSYDRRLTSVVIKTDSLDTIPGYMFTNRGGLASIKNASGNNYDFAGVLRIGNYAFSECKALGGSYRVDSLLSIGNSAFNGTAITGFTAPSLTVMGSSAFEGCNNMTTAVFPYLTEIKENTFRGAKLTKLDISSAVTIGDNAFRGALAMEKVELPKTLVTIGRYAFERNATVKGYVLPDSLHTIGGEAFLNNTALTSLYIPDSVTVIDSNYNGAFQGCTSLEEVVIGSGLTEITDKMFYGCSSLKKLTIGENVEIIGKDAFAYTALEAVNLPASVRTIKDGAFNDGYKGAVKYGGEAVEGGISTLIIPYGVTAITMTEGYSAFSGMSIDHNDTYIKELYLPETIKDLSGLNLRGLFNRKDNTDPDYQLAYEQEGNDVIQYVEKYDGKIYYPGTRSELEAAVFATVTDANGDTLSRSYDTYGKYNVLDLIDIEYGTGFKMVGGKLVFYKEGEPVKAASGKYVVQEAGSNYYLLDENGTYVRDTAYVDSETAGGVTKYYIYYFNTYGLGERQEITDPQILSGSAVYGFFNDSVHAAMTVSGSEPVLLASDSSDGNVPKTTNVKTIGGKQYFAYTNGVLAKGYVKGSTNDGFYFDDQDEKDGRLLWYADHSATPATYYTDTTKETLLGATETVILPDENGTLVSFKNGKLISLADTDLTVTADHATIYTGGESSEISTDYPSAATLTLTVDNTKGFNMEGASVSWSIYTSFPRVTGTKVLTLGTSSGLSGQTSTIGITAQAAGSAKVRATFTDGDGNSAYKDFTITVKELDPMPTGVTVTAGKTTLALDETTTLTATLLPENTTFKTGYDRITWSTSGEHAHYVSLTDNGDGTASIKAPNWLNSADGTSVTVMVTAMTKNGVKGRIRITINSKQGGEEPGPGPDPEPDPEPTEIAVTGVVLNQTAAELYPGESLKLSATVSPANATDKSLSWTVDSASGDSTAVRVDANGKVTAVHAGKAVVIVTANGAASASGSGASGSDGSGNGDGKVQAQCVITVLESEIEETDENGNPIDPGVISTLLEEAKEEGKITVDQPIWVGGLQKSYYYTGNAVKPSIHVYKGHKLLAEKTDYTLSYKNNKNVSTGISDNKKKPQIVIKLKGSYSGSETVYFEIVPMPLDKLTADDLTVAYKAGKKNQLKPVLMYSGAETGWQDTKIKYSAKDITFTWVDDDGEGNSANGSGSNASGSLCDKPGEYAVVISAGASGNFTVGDGTKAVQIATLTVTELVPMSSVKLTGFKASLPYLGKDADGEVQEVKQNAVLKYNGVELKVAAEGDPDAADADCIVTYVNNTEIGVATVIYTGTADADGAGDGLGSGSGSAATGFTGQLKKTFKITGKYTIEASDVSFKYADENGDYKTSYTGLAIKPEVKVVVNGRTLKAGTDYAVTYKNNKAVAGKNETDTKGRSKAPQIIVKGKGNYQTAEKTGITKTFTITKCNLNDLVLTVADKAYNKKANAYKSTKITFTDGNYRDMKLKAGKDYTITVDEILDNTSGDPYVPAPKSVVKVKITGTGANFEGTVTGSYRIIDTKVTPDISKAKAVVGGGKACAYTGSAIEPHDKAWLTENGITGGAGTSNPWLDVTMKAGKETITLHETAQDAAGAKQPGQYEILGYYNNVDKGTAYVLIRGINGYSGIRAVKFKIAASDVKNSWGGVYDAESGKLK